MPGDVFDQVAEKGSGDVFDQASKPKRPKSWPEQIRESQVGPEIVKQVGSLARGVGQTGLDVLRMTPLGSAVESTMEAGRKRQADIPGKFARGVKETVMGPVRELAGLSQPGETPGVQQLPFAERPFAAIGTLLGADPARVRELETQGQTGAAWAARLTIPILNLGIAALLGKAGGKSLPSPEARVNKLTAATGTATTNIPEAYTKVLPRLDETVRTPAPRPGPEILPPHEPWHAGSNPLSPKDLLGNVNATLGRLENEFNLALQPIAGKTIVPTAVSDAIKSKITSAMGQTAKGKEAAAALRSRASEFDKPWTYQQLNDERMRLFRIEKETSAGRLALRTDADLAADKAAENALRDVVYESIEKFHKKPGYFRELKAQESALLDLHDQLHRKIIQATNQEAIRKGTPLLEREHISTYGHPAGRIGVSVHKLQDPFVGGPMTQASRKVKGAFTPKRRIGKVKQSAAAALLGRVPSSGDEEE
jgi:hypothetical protein